MSEEQLPKKNLGGRPPATHNLLAKIKKLEQELVEVKQSKLTEVLSKENLTTKAYSVILEDRRYFLLTLGLDLETGLAQVESKKPIGDNYARAVYELKKLIAYPSFVNEVQKGKK